MIPVAGGEINTTLPLILNIVSAVLCGATCVSFILAIVGIIFAVQAGNAKNAGDLATANAKVRTAMTMAIVSAVLGLIGYGVIGLLRSL